MWGSAEMRLTLGTGLSAGMMPGALLQGRDLRSGEASQLEEGRGIPGCLEPCEAMGRLLSQEQESLAAMGDLLALSGPQFAGL